MTEDRPLQDEHSDSVYRLLEHMCESDTDAAQREQLVGLLRESRSVRRLYVRYMSLHFWLRLRFSRYKEDLHSSELAELFTGPDEKTAEPASGRLWKAAFAVAALVAFVALPAVLWLTRGPAPQPTPVATREPCAAVVTSTHRCRWAHGSVVDRIGQVIHEGDRLCLESGLVRLVFDTGATLIAKGPVDLRVVSADTCVLESGEVVARADHLASGFTVVAGDTKVIDLGTEFGVRRVRSCEVLVQVFEGKVQIVGDQGTAPKLIGNLDSGHLASVTRDEDGNAILQERTSEGTSGFIRQMPEVADVFDFQESQLVVLDGFGRNGGGGPLSGMNSGYGWMSPWRSDTTELTTTDVFAFADSATMRGQGSAAVHRSLPRSLGGESPVFASARFRIDGPDEVCTAWVLLFQQAPRPGGGEANLMAFGISDRRFSARLAPREGDLA